MKGRGSEKGRMKVGIRFGEIKLVATLYIPAVLRINDRTITVLNTQ